MDRDYSGAFHLLKNGFRLLKRGSIAAAWSAQPKGQLLSKKGEIFFPTIPLKDLFGAKMAPFPATLRDFVCLWAIMVP